MDRVWDLMDAIKAFILKHLLINVQLVSHPAYNAHRQPLVFLAKQTIR